MPSSIGKSAVKTLTYVIVFRRASLFMLFTGIFGLVIVNSNDMWNDMFSDPLSANTAGRLIKKEGTVKYKPKKSAIWSEVKGSEHSISNGDSVFTGSDGKAELEVSDGNRAVLNPMSLVVVESNEEAIPGVEDQNQNVPQSFFSRMFGFKPSNVMLKVDSGKVKIDSNGTNMVIQANNKVYKFQSKDKGSIELTVDPNNKQQTVVFRSDGTKDVEVKEVGNPSEPQKPVPIRPGIIEETVDTSAPDVKIEQSNKIKFGGAKKMKKKTINIWTHPLFIAYMIMSVLFMVMGYITPMLKGNDDRA